MRAEDAGARTWLYAALAGWALCVWILAMFGMGGSIDRLDDDPSLLQALPQLPHVIDIPRSHPASFAGELPERRAPLPERPIQDFKLCNKELSQALVDGKGMRDIGEIPGIPCAAGTS